MLAAIAYLREIREKKEIKQIQVAKWIGMSIRQYSRWETGGTQKPDVEKLFKVADYIGASFDHVGRLLIADEATDEDARLLARNYLTSKDRQMIHTVSGEQVEESQRDLSGLSTRDLLAELVRRQDDSHGEQIGATSFAR